MMKIYEFFLKLGGSVWLLTVGLSVLLLIIQWLANWHLNGDGWRILWLWGGGGGLACMILAGVLGIWDK